MVHEEEDGWNTYTRVIILIRHPFREMHEFKRNKWVTKKRDTADSVAVAPARHGDVDDA
jgi:hypothetical protein